MTKLSDYARPEWAAPRKETWYEHLLPQRATDAINQSPIVSALSRYLSSPPADLTLPSERDRQVPMPRPPSWFDDRPIAADAIDKVGLLANFAGPGARPPLPMDFASRMARAEAMGYRLKPVYHGTALKDGQPFNAFDPASTGGRTSGSLAGREGVSVTPSPELASEFAQLAAQRTGGDPAVMALLHRTERPAVLTLDGTERNLEVAATLSDAFRGKHDAVVMRNYTSPGGMPGQTAVVLKEPNQLRSINAAFDPDKANSSDLMASRLLPFLLGLGAYKAAGDTEFGQSSGLYPAR